jgi:hypothetical protein
MRIGGASALAEVGVPDYLIMDMGRWKSLTFLTHVRRSRQMFDRARNALARRDLLTADQINLMNPQATMWQLIKSKPSRKKASAGLKIVDTASNIACIEH